MAVTPAAPSASVSTTTQASSSNCGFFDLTSCVTDLVKSSLQQSVDKIFEQGGQYGRSVMEFAQQAQTAEKCWSCQVYKSLYQGLHNILVEMYQTIVDKSPALMTFSVIILMIVLCFKMLKIIGSPFQQNLAGEWMGVYTYLIRVAIIYPVFLISSVTAGVQDDGKFSPVSDLFISGPTALGSELGVLMAQVACTMNSGMLQPLPVCKAASNFQPTSPSSTGAGSGGTTPSTSGGSTGTSTSGGTTTSGSAATPGNLTYLEQMHQARATQILLTFHQIGVTGITGGVWTATQLPSSPGTNLITRISYVFAGIALAMIYFMLTVTFGFRYIDALIRLMLVGSLAPVFLFLWIFDSTRKIAMAALNQVLFAGAAFAVSGLVVVIAAYIIIAGFEQAFPGSGATVLDASFWANQQTGTWDWMPYFYIIGCALVVSNLAKAIFSIAGELVNANGLTGLGEQMVGQTEKAKGAVQQKVMGALGR